jgi:hypothetical protein
MNSFKSGTDAFVKKPDTVSRDTAELASHMNHCANAQSRFFSLHSALASVQGMVSARIVTVAVAVLASLALLLASAA